MNILSASYHATQNPYYYYTNNEQNMEMENLDVPGHEKYLNQEPFKDQRSSFGNMVF